MKKTIKLFLLCLALSQGVAAQKSIGANGGYGGKTGSCLSGGAHFCEEALAAIESRSAEEDAALPIHFIKDASGHLVMQVSKANLTEEQDRLNYKKKFAFFIDEDFTLDESIRKALYPDEPKSIIIRQGMYAIIEWENHYYIRF
jgi:hypothetical protein